MDKHRTSEALKRFATVLLSVGTIGRPLIGPPHLPAGRLATLRDAYAKMLNDGEFLGEARKREWDVEYTSGQELEAIAKQSVNQPKDVVDRLRKILRD